MKLRTERIKELIREEAAALILHGISDPRLGFCTVTKVDLTHDLSYCTIHVSVLGEKGVKSRTMAALKDARGMIQKHIAKHLKTRTTPHVEIELDEGIEKSFTIMEKIKEARASDTDKGSSTAEAPRATKGDDDEEADDLEDLDDLDDDEDDEDELAELDGDDDDDEDEDLEDEDEDEKPAKPKKK